MILTFLLDRNENKLYWTTFHYPGNLKSASVRGCDVKTLYTTGHTDQFCPIGVYGCAIFYTSNKNLLMLNKTEGHSPTSVYTDSNNIYSIYVYHQRGNIYFRSSFDICHHFLCSVTVSKILFIYKFIFQFIMISFIIIIHLVWLIVCCVYFLAVNYVCFFQISMSYFFYFILITCIHVSVLDNYYTMFKWLFVYYLTTI